MENSTEVVENCGYNSSGGVLYSTFGDGEYDGSGGKLGSNQCRHDDKSWRPVYTILVGDVHERLENDLKKLDGSSKSLRDIS
ncbi:hypothetical protein F2Q68_00041515 [Brassica cretica]|uniref:Uncharacterized protein n=1 Tax=Brassica cretica TaxID=69181 RepID=A0A8S9MNE7_BRACR|nr:hypothetical protein F2Q68_00041515 [Brassica cretica]